MLIKIFECPTYGSGVTIGNSRRICNLMDMVPFSYLNGTSMEEFGIPVPLLKLVYFCYLLPFQNGIIF